MVKSHCYGCGDNLELGMLVGCGKLIFDRNFLDMGEFWIAGSLDLLKPTWPGDRRDDWNRNDYYLGNPRLSRAYGCAKIAAEEKLLIC
jgi:hypothetical protein